MATNIPAEEKWENSEFNQEEEEKEGEEEEALSLCDLPVNLFKEENHSSKEETHEGAETNREDFNFGQCGGVVSNSNNLEEMCAADDIFFQGQILPLRHSISSESSYTRFKHDSFNSIHCLSRSESMDHSGFTSFSCRSSSSTSSSTSSKTRITSKPRIQNNFHSHPSPKPQIIRLPSTTTTLPNNAAASHRNKISSVWDIFRLGLVRTPEIELQDLKARSSVSRNSSCSSSNSNSSAKNCTKSANSRSGNNSKKVEKKRKNQRKQSLIEKRGAKLLSGCSCSVKAVKAVPLNNIVIIKNRNSANINKEIDDDEKLLQDLKMKMKMKKKMVDEKKQEGKQVMSRHRTFEWIKELSHASYVDREEQEEEDS